MLDVKEEERGWETGWNCDIIGNMSRYGARLVNSSPAQRRNSQTPPLDLVLFAPDWELRVASVLLTQGRKGAAHPPQKS